MLRFSRSPGGGLPGAGGPVFAGASATHRGDVRHGSPDNGKSHPLSLSDGRRRVTDQPRKTPLTLVIYKT
ncbi:hypothetical protein HVIM_04551 (plasmid) [Roseomonas mucosa]|nr:hypothetical protein HVIM_04551 [Roseomonas mucosa]QDD97949.1 hypothetical protein ADP8_04551 [Roseomonas mucosa]UZO94490.1 hypothetical protein RMP42_04551 [Roseomonas mucosa]